MLPANPSATDFMEFRVEDLVDNSVTDFDLFLSMAGQMVLYSGIGYRWYREELKGLLEAGTTSFLMRREDAHKGNMYLALGDLPEVSRTLAPSDRIQVIDDIGARLTRCLYEGELTEACVAKASDLARGLVDCIVEDTSCIKAIRSLADHDAYTYHHSVRVAAYTVAIAIGMGADDHHHLFQMALGGLFHDVGKRDIPLVLLNKRGQLTPEEWGVMRSHPRSGWRKLGPASLSHISMEIVLHHHERRNGTGYPDGLEASELLPEVQIATLADIFDALTSNRAYQLKRSRFDALAFIKDRLLHEEVSLDAYKALVGVLAG